ncbi:MAG: alpha-L-rhamnosidase [Thalassobius sp.]|nr:alpha-L-rhamnosidase [Thalassovita sp.]
MKMKKIILPLSLLLMVSYQILAQVSISEMLLEHRINPIGIDIEKPRFSWKIESDKRNTMQSAYEVRVAKTEKDVSRGKNLVWTSGKVNTDQSVYINYKGEALKPNTRYYWQVRVWDNHNKASKWSNVAYWHTGFFNTNAWTAKWISPGYTEDKSRPSPYFRKEFSASKSIQSATAFITSHGVYEARINGQRVGDAYLTPGWTSYNKRLQYQVYDVTSQVKTGANAIGVSLGNGWYRGKLAWEKGYDHFGTDISLIMQLHVQYTDGSEEVIITDDSWKSSTGPITSVEIYNGEKYDARKELSGWDKTGYDDSKWKGVKVENFDNSNLVATYNEPIRKHETFEPQAIFRTPKNELVVDFGQNLVGWVQIKVKGKAGDEISIYHSEVLDKEGNFYTTNLRAADQENVYTLKGGDEEFFEPHFTFQGFRYIKVEGFPGELQKENLTAVALYSDMEKTGTFSSSDPLINQLQHNIQWGQRGNFLDVPTDCPQRDERLGWTGDAQAFARTASYNFDVKNFFSKWLKDLAADQKNGSVPHVIPNVLGENGHGSAGWADAATIIPWTMYLAYGDTAVLEEQFESMKSWVDYIGTKSNNNLWNTGFHFGDWLFYRPFDDNSGMAAVTDKYLIAQCFYTHSVDLVVKAAKVLGKSNDVSKYEKLAQQTRDAFKREYLTPNGRLVSSTQTAYVLALHFDMLPENLRKQAAERLVENVQRYNNHLTTGFLGTPYLCHVLSANGYDDVAYTLLMQKSYPSWLYPVTMGATTIWERWDGIKPDSTFQNPGMNSFNHYAYGAIGDWMYRNITGLDTEADAPGYKQIVIKPTTGGGLTQATASLESNYGQITSGWDIASNVFKMNVVIPVNTTATVYIPSESENAVMENGQNISTSKDIEILGMEGKYLKVKVGSGDYNFQVATSSN